jgi:GNAT superfamily N-acetyltransferase
MIGLIWPQYGLLADPTASTSGPAAGTDGGKLGDMDTIRSLEQGDWEQWEPLWQGYLDFYRAELSEATTRHTFTRLVGHEEGMFALLAVDDAGNGVGLAHCIVHSTTWSSHPYCYLEDLFVSPPARGSNLGRDLLKETKQASVGRGAERLYWHTQAFNGRARSLYDVVAHPTSFVVYEM